MPVQTLGQNPGRRLRLDQNPTLGRAERLRRESDDRPDRINVIEINIMNTKKKKQPQTADPRSAYECALCGGHDTYVVRTRRAPDGRWKRTRCCRGCKRVFVTFESNGVA